MGFVVSGLLTRSHPLEPTDAEKYVNLQLDCMENV